MLEVCCGEGGGIEGHHRILLRGRGWIPGGEKGHTGGMLRGGQICGRGRVICSAGCVASNRSSLVLTSTFCGFAGVLKSTVMGMLAPASTSYPVSVQEHFHEDHDAAQESQLEGAHCLDSVDTESTGGSPHMFSRLRKLQRQPPHSG